MGMLLTIIERKKGKDLLSAQKRLRQQLQGTNLPIF
jgi:hypothetical protein